MKRPWMPLYVGDYLAKTSHLTTLQHGAYLLLILHYWANGGLPTQPEALMAIARLGHDEWRSNCQVLHNFFSRDWKHSRIDEELAKCDSLREKRRLAGVKGAWKRHGFMVVKS